MDGGRDHASEADPTPSATKANLGGLELRLVREMNTQERWPIGTLVTGIATAVSQHP